MSEVIFTKKIEPKSLTSYLLAYPDDTKNIRIYFISRDLLEKKPDGKPALMSAIISARLILNVGGTAPIIIPHTGWKHVDLK